MFMRPGNPVRTPIGARSPRRMIGLCGVTAALSLFVATAAAQAPPPTLTGETLVGGVFAPPGMSSLVVTSASCNPSGNSTFTYQASGPAGPPYVGTYTETGTVTIGPQTIPGTPPNGLVTSWTANFTIT